MPDYAKDVMLGVLGASVGLGGLLLVFCGFIFGQAASFPPATTDDKIITKYRDAARFGVWPFLGALLDALLAVLWFVYPICWIYVAALSCFVLLLVVTGVYGSVVMKSYL